MDPKNNWNLKKFVICLTAIVFITYGLGSIILFSSPKSVFNNEKSTYGINDEKAASISGITDISINVSSTNINIIPSDGTEVKAKLYGNVITTSPYSKPELQCYTQGETLFLNVQKKASMTFNFFTPSVKLDVYIPSSYTNNLKLSSSSGSINIKNLKLNNLRCNASSGSTSIQDITADSFQYGSSSGSLRADGLATKTSSLSSSSGSQRITRFTGDLKASSSSGSIKVEYVSFDNNIDASASSGSIEIKLPESAAFYLDASASSGSVRSDFPVTVTGKTERNQLKGTVLNDKNKVRIRTSSGSITITK
jgi:lia operon protein LiaG